MTIDPDPDSEPTVPQTPAAHRRGRRLPGVPVALGATVVVALVAVVVLTTNGRDATPPASPGTPGVNQASPEALQTALDAAKETCAAHTPAVSLGDGGRSLIVERIAAEVNAGADIDELVCILTRIDVPDAVVSQMEGTRALDGRQQASWDGFTASWTYHPDDGLNVILQETI
jgi:hypothetical protein